MAAQNPDDDEIVKIMETWKEELENGRPINELKDKFVEYGVAKNAIRLHEVTEFVESKQIDGKSSKLVSFNLIGYLGLIQKDVFLEHSSPFKIRCRMENFDPRLLTRQKVIIEKFAPVAK